MQALLLYTSYMQIFALHTLSTHVFRHTLNLCDPHRKSNTPGIFCSRNERPFNYTSGLRQGPLSQSVFLINLHLCFYQTASLHLVSAAAVYHITHSSRLSYRPVLYRNPRTQTSPKNDYLQPVHLNCDRFLPYHYLGYW